MNGFSSRSLLPQRRAPERRHAGNGGILARMRTWLRGGVHTVGTWGPKKTLWRGAGAFGVACVLYFAWIWVTLPDISDPRSLLATQSSVIVDRNGVELYRLYNEQDRTFVENDQIPENLKHAIVAIEDQRYYDRGCIDLQAVARAVFHFGQSGGASTLTRQLARNALNLQQENLLSRKLKEFVLGCELEHRYSKDDLLAMYLNWIPFGSNAYGVEQASEAYFSVHAKDLTLAQAAVLASLPQAPSYYNPYGKHVHTTANDAVTKQVMQGKITKASQISDNDVQIGLLGGTIGTGSTVVHVGGRTDQVLQNMQNLGYITETQRLQALSDLETMAFAPSRENIRAPHFVLWIKDQVQKLLPTGSDQDLLEQGGLRIETTLDWNLQQAAEDSVAFYRDSFAKLYNIHNIALTSIDPKTGEVLAYVGNSNYNDTTQDGKVDMVRSPRQPGSSFKPFVYAAAFEKGYGPATVIADVPTTFGGQNPQNFDGNFWGLLTARKALAGSRNIPAMKAFFLAGGEDNVLGMASRLGAPTPENTRDQMRQTNPDYSYGYPLAIGSAETPLLEMTDGYATFADGGVPHAPIALKRITDQNGAVLYEAKPEQNPQPVIDPRIAYEITSILSDVSARPNDFWKQILSVPGYQTAAKTGTSNKCLETQANGDCTKRLPDSLWTLGYTPGIVTGVWMGNSNGQPLFEKAESLSQAAPLWQNYMIKASKILKNVPTTFPEPSGITQLQVSTLSGQLPSDCTPINDRAPDIFLNENIPTQPDTACAMLTVDKVTGLLASDACPADAQDKEAFFVPQSVAADRWPGWQQGLTKWAQDQQKKWDADPAAHSGSLLPLPLAPTQECDPSLTPGRLEKPTVSIVFPAKNGTATYPAFHPVLQKTVGSGISEIDWSLDGKLVARWGSGSTFDDTITLPRSVKKDSSPHTLQVTLIDKYFNKATDSVTFTFADDKDNPTVQWSSPNDGATLRQGASVDLKADASDAGSGIKYVQFYLDDTLLSTRPDAPYELSYTVKETPGSHTLRAKAFDNAGNTAETTEEITVAP